MDETIPVVDSNCEIDEDENSIMARYFIFQVNWLVAVVLWLSVSSLPGDETSQQTTWTDLQRTQGYVAFQHHHLHLLDSSFTPVPEVVTRKTITCSLARGQYEAVQIGVHALARDINQVRLTVESDVAVRVFRRIDEKVHSLLDGYVNQVPQEIRGSLLDESDQIATISVGTTAPFWLTFHAGLDTPPGQHRGQVRITVDRAEGKTVLEFDLEVQVHPFVLERARIAYFPFFYFDFINGQGLPHFAITDKRWVEALYRDMAEHSHTSVSFYGYPGPRIDLTKELPPPESPYTSLLLPLTRKVGLTTPDIPVVSFMLNLGAPASRGGSSTAQKNRALDWLQAEWRRQGWPELIHYGQDEPGYPSRYSPSLEEENGPLRAVKIRMGTAMCARAAYGLGDYFDVWIMEAGHITPELTAEAERLGAQIWTYSGIGATEPLKQRYFAGIFAWAKKVKGHTTWHHYAQTSNKMIWMRQGDEGPMPTVGWETRREGIDDFRYLQMLEDRIYANSESLVAAAAGGWLEGLRSRINLAPDPNKAGPGVPLERIEYEQIRAKAAQYIQQLSPPPPGQIKPHAVTRLKDEARLFRKRTMPECIEALQRDDMTARRGAALALKERGAQAVPAIAALVEQLNQPEVRIPALRALEAIGPQAAPLVPKVTALYSHPDAFVRLAATFVLCRMGPSAAEALQVALLDEFPPLAEVAGEGLGDLGPAAEPALPTLIKMLAMSQHYQFVALRTIERIGPGAAPAMPMLLKQWAAIMPRHRSTYFLNAFLAIGVPHANDVVPLLDEFIEKYAFMDTVHGNKATAYYALCRFRGAPEDLDGLVDMIENPPSDPVHPNFPVNQDVASHLLAVLGPEAKAAAPRVRKLLRDGGFDQRVVDRLNTFLGTL